jgi:hypothetical protein
MFIFSGLNKKMKLQGVTFDCSSSVFKNAVSLQSVTGRTTRLTEYRPINDKIGNVIEQMQKTFYSL